MTTRPLALIEGRLALPKALPFNGVPPPFGSWRRASPAAALRQPHPLAATPAQQAMQDAVQRKPASSMRGNPFPAGVKHVFLYKLPKQPDFSHRIDAQLAEARRYLEMGKSRFASSRSDHVLGAAIFVSCSIALAWLLATCSTHESGKVTPPVPNASHVTPGTAEKRLPPTAATVPVSRGAVSPATPTQPVDVEKKAAPQAVATLSSPRDERGLRAAASDATPQSASQLGTPITREAAPLERRAVSEINPPAARSSALRPAPRPELRPDRRPDPRPELRPDRRPDPRIAPTPTARTTATATATARPSVSKQPEWTARPPVRDDTAARSPALSPDSAALLNWAAQLRQAQITTRANVPIAGDTDWSTHMTQRRITENPGAFEPTGGQP